MKNRINMVGAKIATLTSANIAQVSDTITKKISISGKNPVEEVFNNDREHQSIFKYY